MFSVSASVHMSPLYSTETVRSYTLTHSVWAKGKIPPKKKNKQVPDACGPFPRWKQHSGGGVAIVIPHPLIRFSLSAWVETMCEASCHVYLTALKLQHGLVDVIEKIQWPWNACMKFQYYYCLNLDKLPLLKDKQFLFSSTGNWRVHLDHSLIYSSKKHLLHAYCAPIMVLEAAGQE